MPGDNIQFGPPPVSNTNPVGGVSFGTPPEGTATNTPTGNSTVSTIQPSTEQQAEDAITAGNPIIPFPLLQLFFDANESSGKTIDITTVSKLWNAAEQTAILSLLDKWHDSLVAEKKRRSEEDLNPTNVRKREEEESPFINLLAAVQATSVTPSEKSSESASVTSATSASINAAASAEETRDSLVPLLTVGLIFAGTGGVSDSMMVDTLSTDMVGVNPRSNQAPALALYVPDMRAELGLLGAALLQGAAYMANAQTVFGSEKGPAAGPDITAKNYAEEILKLIGSGQLTNMINAIVTSKTDPTKPPDKAEVNKLAKTLEAQLKVILLATALAALYTSENEGGTGWIKAEDFEGLLSGDNKTFGKNKESMDKILDAITKELASLPDGGSNIRGVLAEFFNKNPSLDVLTNPAKVFAQLLPYVRRDTDHIPA